MNFSKLLFEKKEFLILVFFNLIVQLGVTYYVMENIDTNMSYWLLAFFGLVLVVLLCLPMHPFLKFLLFLVFSYVGGLICRGIKKVYSEEEIKASMEGTFILFGAMMLLGIGMVVTGIKISTKVGYLLLLLLCGIIVARVLSLLTNVSMFNKIITLITLIVFSIYVIYDTYIILSKNYYGDFISASLDYYLDVLNIFTAMNNN